MNSRLSHPASYGSELTDSERKFAAVEAASEKMLKDSVIFRDSVQGTSVLSRVRLGLEGCRADI
jgi:hypothetical protein